MLMLGPISLLDCLAFCVFLAIQLPLQVGLFETIGTIITCLPFLLTILPWTFIRDRFIIPAGPQRSPFSKVASPFEDLVIRCVRFAFANVPPNVGRVFFSKPVALPFLRFRMLRHGYFKSPIHWREYSDKNERFKGVWIIHDPTKRPDVCIFYAHGGGFMMGSSYFYLEYLLTWLSLLSGQGYKNPAIFAFEYTLVPDVCFPVQLKESIAAYEHVLNFVEDASKICVAGDSAGAGIVLTMLFHMASTGSKAQHVSHGVPNRLEKPGYAVLISPWVTMVSSLHKNTASDYLEANHLHNYAKQYAGGANLVNDSLVSPGSCRDISWWKNAFPENGMHITYGAEEMLASGITNLIEFLGENDFKVTSRAETSEVHAWPVVSLFLCDSVDDRRKGLSDIVNRIKENISIEKGGRS